MAQVVTDGFCKIEMEKLRAAPFNLVQAAQIIAKVQAQNVIGWSNESSINAVVGAVLTAPVKPGQTPSRAPTSSHAQLVVNWLALSGSDNGGSPILSYGL